MCHFFEHECFQRLIVLLRIFLAVPLAEPLFFLRYFTISIIAKEKASFFSFDKAVYLIALPHQNLNAPPLCGKKNS